MFVERDTRSTSPVRETPDRRNAYLTCRYTEPPIGIEPMTYALRETCDLAAHALTAPMAAVIALMALAALELSGEPVHARGLVSYFRLL